MPDPVSLQAPSLESLTSWLAGWMVKEFKVDRESIEPGQAFLSFGMDSVQAMTMVGDLESDLNLRLSPTLVWDYPTIGELADHLAEQLGVSSPATCRRAGPSDEVAAPEQTSLLGDRPIDGLLTQMEFSQ